MKSLICTVKTWFKKDEKDFNLQIHLKETFVLPPVYRFIT